MLLLSQKLKVEAIDKLILNIQQDGCQRVTKVG